jgi:hypothetical protein
MDTPYIPGDGSPSLPPPSTPPPAPNDAVMPPPIDALAPMQPPMQVVKPRAWWKSWSIIIPAVVGVFLIIGFIANRGSTDAEDLNSGDCFEFPGLDNIRDVKDEPCDGPHESEVLAKVEAPGSAPFPSSALPGSTAGEAEQACNDAVANLDVNFENVPEDAALGFFYPARESWADGDRTLTCYVTSVTGFPGPVLAAG